MGSIDPISNTDMYIMVLLMGSQKRIFRLGGLDPGFAVEPSGDQDVYVVLLVPTIPPSAPPYKADRTPDLCKSSPLRPPGGRAPSMSHPAGSALPPSSAFIRPRRLQRQHQQVGVGTIFNIPISASYLVRSPEAPAAGALRPPQAPPSSLSEP